MILQIIDKKHPEVVNLVRDYIHYNTDYYMENIPIVIKWYNSNQFYRLKINRLDYSLIAYL